MWACVEHRVEVGLGCVDVRLCLREGERGAHPTTPGPPGQSVNLPSVTWQNALGPADAGPLRVLALEDVLRVALTEAVAVPVGALAEVGTHRGRCTGGR